MRSTTVVARVGALVLAGVVAVAGPSAGAAAAPRPQLPGVVVAAPGDEVTFTGHGWGHGRGMGQYGALGYAVDHGWGYQQILTHFYSNTTAGSIGNPEVTVELTALVGSQLVATGTNLLVNGAPIGATPAVVAKLQPDGSVNLVAAASCAGPEGGLIGTYPGGVSITTAGASSTADPSLLVQVCEPNGVRAYRGSLTVQRHAVSGAQTTFNRVSMDDYLRGVVPRESPASWGSLGGGRGQQALMAQAVAARSYAQAGGNRPSGAKTCDTTACQVYGGAGLWPVLAPRTRAGLEEASTDAAVVATSGQVRMLGGAVARTEFSSSTGGYTVAGAFPAVVDLGDAISLNPNHTWTTTLTTAEIGTRLGISGVRAITVTARNGLGDWGGRVTQVVVVDGAGGSHTYTGAAFRTAMGTDRFKSDWFTLSWISPAQAASLVTALYHDLLGRGPDPTGLAGWSTALLTGTSQSVLVDTLTRSDEYIALRVAKAYTEVLGRAPDPAGAQSWLVAIRSRQATVDDVQRRFYDSTEFFLTAGGTPDGYVRLLYTTVLRRPASDAEVAGWAAYLAQRGRAWVVDNIWFSLEAASIRSGDYYRTFLGREPDPAGQLAWAQVLLAYGEGAVRVGIAGSEEYKLRAVARFP